MKTSLGIEIYAEAIELQRLGNRAVKRAQEENRKKGVPNVYSYNGELYYELPNGELTKEDPTARKGRKRKAESHPQKEKPNAIPQKTD